MSGLLSQALPQAALDQFEEATVQHILLHLLYNVNCTLFVWDTIPTKSFSFHILKMSVIFSYSAGVFSLMTLFQLSLGLSSMGSSSAGRA